LTYYLQKEDNVILKGIYFDTPQNANKMLFEVFYIRTLITTSIRGYNIYKFVTSNHLSSS